MPIRELSDRLLGNPYEQRPPLLPSNDEPTPDASMTDSTLRSQTSTSRRKFPHPPPRNAITFSGESARESKGDANDSDEEEGGVALTGGKRRLSPVAECRDRSRSAWLHFPHMELVFLFFAFEGVVASQASALRNARCPGMFFTAMVVLVSRSRYSYFFLLTVFCMVVVVVVVV